MTYFNLNVSKLDSSISKYNSSKKNSCSDLKLIYDSLKNTDSAWNGVDADSFIKSVKNDQYKVNNYFDELDLLYKQIENFKISFENLFSRYGFKRGSTIRYDDGYYQNCIKNLNNTITYLNNALYYLNNCNFKSDFPEIYRVYTLRNEIKKMKNALNEIINSITAFKKAIDKILADSRIAFAKVGNISLNAELLSYNWKLAGGFANNNLKTEKIDELSVSLNKADLSVSEVNNKNLNLGNNKIATVSLKNSGVDYNYSSNLDLDMGDIKQVNNTNAVSLNDYYSNDSDNLKNINITAKTVTNTVPSNLVFDDSQLNINNNDIKTVSNFENNATDNSKYMMNASNLDINSLLNGKKTVSDVENNNTIINRNKPIDLSSKIENYTVNNNIADSNNI